VTNPKDSDLLRDIDPDWQSAAIGTPVIASDGKPLGMVLEKRDDGLYVRGAAGGMDYLVPPADIASVGADGVRLAVTASQAMRVQPESAAERATPDSGGQMAQPS
jgi:hypothetical protein